MLYKPVNWLLEKLAYGLVDLGHAVNMPLLTSLAWRLALKEMKDISPRGYAAKKLIVLAKSGGTDDLRAAFDAKPAGFKIYIIPRRLVKRSCGYFLGGRVSDARYLSDDVETEESKLAYRAYLCAVLRCYRKLFGCDAFVQFNFVYHAERELAAACAEEKIPFVCDYKESLRSPAFWKETEIWYQDSIGPFAGWKIAVYNAAAREAIKRSGIAASWQIETVGCARLDFSHHLRSLENTVPSRPMVLFFMIQESAGLPYLDEFFRKDGEVVVEEPGRALTWRSLAARVNAIVLKFAKNNPDVDFIFKGKTGFSAAQRERLGEDVPPNVALISDGVGDHLIAKAAVVVGFNSTVVLEAIAAGRSVVVPALLGHEESFLRPYLHDVGDAAVVAESAQEFEQSIANAVRNHRLMNGDLPAEHKRVLRKHLGNDDGRAGDRLRKFVEDAVYTDLSMVRPAPVSPRSPLVDEPGASPVPVHGDQHKQAFGAFNSPGRLCLGD